MYCPYCRHPDSRVIDSRTAEDGAAIRRRRSCPACGRRFTTQETVILMVAKRSGVTEPFNRDKIVRGVRRACQGRPVTEDQLAILGPLRDLDEVAYLRFASVYRGFESLADFEDEITALRSERGRTWRTGDQDGPRLPGDEALQPAAGASAVGVPARASARASDGITGPGQARDGTRRIPEGGEHDRDDG